MSTQQIDPQVAALFSKANKQAANSTPDTGEGWQGEWPPEGVTENAITGITMKPAKVKRYVNKVEREFDCVSVRFAYQVIPDENEPGYDAKKPPLKWQGKPMEIISDADFDSIPEDDNSRYGFKLNADRLKGFAVKLLNRTEEECSNMGEFCGQLNKLLSDTDRRVVASIRTVHRKYQGTKKGSTEKVEKVDKADYCVERLDRAS